jgi:hypothetical protein
MVNQGTLEPAPRPRPPAQADPDRGNDVSQPPEPLSLERARLLLIWLQAQRTVDACLSELLAAGPAGEQRVSGQIERVTELVETTAEAFAAYRESVLKARAEESSAEPYERPVLTAVPALPRDSSDAAQELRHSR